MTKYERMWLKAVKSKTELTREPVIGSRCSISAPGFDTGILVNIDENSKSLPYELSVNGKSTRTNAIVVIPTLEQLIDMMYPHEQYILFNFMERIIGHKELLEKIDSEYIWRTGMSIIMQHRYKLKWNDEEWA